MPEPEQYMVQGAEHCPESQRNQSQVTEQQKAVMNISFGPAGGWWHLDFYPRLWLWLLISNMVRETHCKDLSINCIDQKEEIMAKRWDVFLMRQILG